MKNNKNDEKMYTFIQKTLFEIIALHSKIFFNIFKCIMYI